LADAYDIVVAGGGVAGLTAGLTAARLGRRTLVLTGATLGGNLLSIEKIEGWPGAPDGIAGYELCPALQEQASMAGAVFAMEEAASIEPAGDRWVIAAGGAEHEAASVIVATGGSFRRLGVDGEARLTGRGVSHCASCDAPMLRGKQVAVIGGGDSAVQEALALAGTVSRVALLTRGDRLTAEAGFRARAEAASNIDIRVNCEIREILGGDTVTGVRVADRESGAVDDLEADGVFVYIGLQPNTAFLDGRIALDPAGRIPVDGMMRSDLPGLFAAGLARGGAVGRAAASAGDGTTAAIAADRYLAGGGWRES